VKAHTDGGCFRNGDMTAKAGSGGWFGDEHPNNFAIRVGKNIKQDNNAGEMLAILTAARKSPSKPKLQIISDSTWAINALTINRRTNEDRGYIDVQHSNLIQATIAELQARQGDTTLTWVKGHNGTLGNEEADRLAGEGADMDTTEDTDVSVHKSQQIRGAKLSKMKQKSLYRGIRAQRAAKIQKSRKVKENLRVARVTTKERMNQQPPDSRFWKALRDKNNIPNNISAWLWKTIHGAHKIGAYWHKIPQYEHRGNCLIEECEDATEDLNHILFECPANHGKEAWKIADELLKEKDIDWPTATDIHEVIAATVAEIKDKDGKKRQGASRLYKIITLITAWTIWKVRNERVVGENPTASRSEVANKLRAEINEHFTQDRLSPIYMKANEKQKAAKKKLVLKTWSGVISSERQGEMLPDDWIQQHGVLVGNPSRRPNGKNR
ncbi:ribonuclease H-like protein, partial [Clavulina sp. PMI_390]